MILTSHTPNFALDCKLQADNFLNPLVNSYSEDDYLEVLAQKMIKKMQLIAKMHGQILDNVSQAQMKQKKNYVSRKGKQMFARFIEGESYVKMKKLGKNITFISSWEGPFFL